MNPEARDYWVKNYAYSSFKYSTPTLAGTWNDMNEPATFGGGEENSLPGNTIHFGGVRHRDIHNAYGFLNVSEMFIILITGRWNSSPNIY